MLALVVVLTVTVAVLAVLVCGLLRSHAEILRALHGLGANLDPGVSPAGAQHPHGASNASATPAPLPWPDGSRIAPTGPAHDLVGRDRDGNPLAVSVRGTSHQTLLAFLSTGCSTCKGLWAGLSSGLPTSADLRVVVVVQDADAESPAALLAEDSGEVPLIASTDAWRDYAVPGSPHFVLVDGPSGTVRGEGAAASWGQVFDLFGQAVADAAATSTVAATATVAAASTVSAASATTHRPAPGAEASTGRDNAARIDAELAAQGIGPGHPSLYPGRT